jgi:hypothetical protein
MSEEESKEGENLSVLRSLARKLRKTTEPEDGSLLGSFLETGDKAKTEIIRMIAKEIRSYLEALEIHKDLKHVLTNYSLEVKASINLKELIQEEESPKDKDESSDVARGEVSEKDFDS